MASPQPAGSSRRKDRENSIPPPAFTQRGDFGLANRKRGEKRRFGAAGIVNLILTNLALQALLLSHLVGVITATLISQVINSMLGYAIYGKMVFRTQRLKSYQPPLRYLTLMTALWLINATGIEACEAININKNLAAASLIPLLAVISYCVQKYWVFRQ